MLPIRMFRVSGKFDQVVLVMNYDKEDGSTFEAWSRGMAHEKVPFMKSINIEFAE